MIQAAESGLGIAFVYQSLVTQQLSAGSFGPFVTRLPLSCRPFLRLLPKPETYSRPPAGLYHWVMAQNKNILGQQTARHGSRPEG